MQFECCGLDSYEDYANAQQWERTRDFLRGNTTVTYTLETPITCCKTSGRAGIVDHDQVDQDCAVYPTHENSNFKQVPVL